MSKTNDVRRTNSTDELLSGGKAGDTANRVEVRADGSIVAGPGGTTAPDTTLRRAGVGAWAVPMPVLGHTPTDADFATPPPDGTLAIFGTNIYARLAGVWTLMSVPPTAPGPPTIGTATAGNANATANWTAPVSDGGSAITGYEVKTYDSGGTLLFTNTVGVVLTYLKTGLTNGSSYKFKVAAINAIGTGAQSAFSNTVTPAVPAAAADNFNRADAGSLGTSSSGLVWTQHNGAWAIASNKAHYVSGVYTVATLESGLSDCTVSAVVNLPLDGSVREAHVVFRLSDGTNYWFAYVKWNTVSAFLVNLYKRVAGVPTQVGPTVTIGGPSAGDHTLSVVLAGNAIEVFLDGISQIAQTDSFNATATRHGIQSGFEAAETASTFDNFSVTA